MSTIQGVRSADIVTGPYDVVGEHRCARRLVVSKIQAVEGITGP